MLPATKAYCSDRKSQLSKVQAEEDKMLGIQSLSALHSSQKPL